MNGIDDDRSAPREDALTKRAANLFDDSVQGLDAQTRSRLNQGRQQALATAGRQSVMWNAWLPAGAAAAVAMVAVVMWNGKEQTDAFTPPVFDEPTMATDFELLMDQEELEMLEELEFYSWIDSDEELNDVDPDQNVG